MSAGGRVRTSAAGIFLAVTLVYFGLAAYHDLYLNRFCGCGPPSEILLTGAPTESELLAELTAVVPVLKRVSEKTPEAFPWLYRKLYPFPAEYVEVKGSEPGLVRRVAGLLQARQALPVRCLSRGVANEAGDNQPFVAVYLPRLEPNTLQKLSRMP